MRPDDAPTSSKAAPTSSKAARGAKLGRFEVTGAIGRGAMGEVVRARDPALGREVAIKVLASQALGRPGPEGPRARLVREAQAMAKVKHPNVVTVYEVDVSGPEVLVVMEYVEGTTLRALGGGRRKAAEVLGAYAQAARGLHEVHRAGLVHRDFKPDNVLVGVDGRVCVTDFGLVGLAGDVPAARGAWRGAGPPTDALLTRSGALLGTPAYMAPEQHEGRPVDARADQFAFCVALWEALTGERPFGGETYEELRANVLGGVLREPPRGTGLSARVRRVLIRGLSASRDARYPDVGALLADLLRDPSAVWRRALGTGGVLALAGVAAFGLARRTSPPALCGGGEAKLAGTWGEATKAKARAAFLGTGRPYAEDTYRRVEQALDERARAWEAAYADSCEATHVRGEQSMALLDLRTACLERRRQELAALTTIFAQRPDAEVLDRAVQASLSLPNAEACSDTIALSAAVPPPSGPTERARAEALRGRVAEVRALGEAGKYQEALALARPLADEARAAAYAPVEAQALLALGRAERDAHESKAAEATLRKAALAAARAKDDALAAEAWTALIYVIGYLDARHGDALALGLAAEGAVARAGGDAAASAELLGTVGSILREQGKYDEAAQYAELTVALLDKTLGPRHPQLATALGRWGSALAALERYPEAEAAYRRALAVREETLGPEHPAIALMLSSLARVANDQGRSQEALPYLERALAIQERSLGPEHPFLAATLNNRAAALNLLGDSEGAAKDLERLLAIREKTLGPDHRDVGTAINNLGAVRETQGKLAEAEALYERALAIRQKALDPGHPEIGSSLANLGRVLLTQKRLAEGLGRVEQALAIQEKALGPDSLTVATSLTLVAAGHYERKRHDKAVVLLERAHAIQVKRGNECDATSLADTNALLAKALWAAGRDRPRAVALARQARDLYAAEKGEYARQTLGEVKAWLAAHEAG